MEAALRMQQRNRLASLGSINRNGTMSSGVGGAAF